MAYGRSGKSVGRRVARLALTLTLAGLACAAALPRSLRRAVMPAAAAAATFKVTSTSDSGPGSLRQAILDANAAPGRDTIAFQIGSGFTSIKPLTPLPQVSDPAVIDATTQPGYAGFPLVELDGSAASGNGLFISGGDTEVRGLVINRFSGDGVVLTVKGGNVVASCYIGANAFGTGALGNGQNGVNVTGGSAGNTVGGTAPSGRNVISGNGANGVRFSGSKNSFSSVVGNYIGTNADGTSAVPNGGDGVLLDNCSQIGVGGVGAEHRNVISGNKQNGVRIAGGSSAVFVNTNYVGTDAAGAAAVGNGGAGVLVGDSSDNHVGGSLGARNVISGNFRGVHISGAVSAGNTVRNNLIGMDAGGQKPLGNKHEGVYVQGPNNVIGGAGAGNGIADNEVGVLIAGEQASGNRVIGNRVGLIAGNEGLGNKTWGVRVEGSPNNRIGEPGDAAGNGVIFNQSGGVLIRGPKSTGNSVQGNSVGPPENDLFVGGNRGPGVELDGASGNLVGGEQSGQGNTISGNRDGVVLRSGAAGNAVRGNIIGPHTGGLLPKGNDNGVRIIGSSDNTVGGLTPGARNVIASSSSAHVFIEGGSTGNSVQGNYIGLNVTGKAGIDNEPAEVCVLIHGSSNNLVGGPAPGARNVISRCSRGGVVVRGPDASGNRIQGNYLGTDKDGNSNQTYVGTNNLRNGGHVRIQGGFDNLVGGAGPGEGNLTGLSDGPGMAVEHGWGNAFLGNSVYGSSQQGIELFPLIPTYTPNDPLDADFGPNRGQNFPVLHAATAAGASLDVRGVLDSEPNRIFRVELFASPQCHPSGHGEGKTYLGFREVTTDAAGHASFDVALPYDPGAGELVTATATGPDGDASQFSPCVRTAGPNPGQFQFAYYSSGVNETGGQGTVVVTRSHGATGRVTVNYETSEAFNPQNYDPQFVAKNGLDYTAVSGTLVFEDGEVFKTFNVPVFDDAVAEGQFEPVGLKLSSPTGGATLAPANDIGGGITATLDIFDHKQTRPFVFVEDVAVSEGASGAKQAVFKLRAEPHTGVVKVRYFTTDGTARAGEDYVPVALDSEVVTFNPGETEKTIAVTVKGDAAFEKDEVFFLNIFDVIDGDLDRAIASSPREAVILNDDAAASTLQFDAALYEVPEAAGAATVTVKRTGALGSPVSVQYSTSDHTAQAPGDYTHASGTLSFNAQETSKTFTVTVKNDSDVEAAETVRLTLGSATGGAATGVPSEALLKITDDDDAPPAQKPSASVSDVTVAEGDAGTTAALFTVTLSSPAEQPVSLPFTTGEVLAINGAKAGSDFTHASGTVVFAPGETAKTIAVQVNGDADFETDEVFLLSLGAPAGGTADVAKSLGKCVIANDDAAPTPQPTPTPEPEPASGIFQFEHTGYEAQEDSTHLTLTVTRSGDLSAGASVDYETQAGTADDRGDFTTAIGTLRFAPGEAAKSFDVLLTEDSTPEAAKESFRVALSSPSPGYVVGPTGAADVTVADDAAEPSLNASDDAEHFVRQHYHDFLGREADDAGLAFWKAELLSCDSNAACVEAKRQHVSAAFFLSIEFQETGFLVHMLSRATYGEAPRYRDFVRDARAVGEGVVVGRDGWEQRLEQNRQAFISAWAARPEFKAKYDGMSNEQYVAALYQNLGLSPSQAEFLALVAALDSSSESRGSALLKVVNSPAARQREQNSAFVLMQYFGYLRRNPDDAPDADFSGFNFWLAKLDSFNGDFVQAEMVKAFLSADEYRKRFGQ